ncbi:MAG: phenylacetate--CoA ligase family protein [Candidatus Helarchaeota archaeon]
MSKFRDLDFIKEKDLIKLQEQRLRKIIKYAYDNTRLYHNKLKSAGITPDTIKTLDDLRKIPFSSKIDIVNDPEGAVGDMQSVFKIHTTSGTSGRGETIVFFTKNDWDIYVEQNARCLLRCGCSSEDRYYNSTPYGMFFAGQVLHDGAKALGGFIIPASTLKTGMAHLKNIFNPIYRPTVFIGLPQYFLRWGNTYKKLGKDPRKSSLKKAYVLGEPVPPAVRKKIEDLWGVDCKIGYGLSEIGAGSECEEKNGIHWPEDEVIVEVIDPKTGESLGPNEKGELVYTTLTKNGTIAIRYKSGDESSILERDCPCGRKITKISLIEQRLDDLTKIKATLVSPYQIENAMFSNEIRGYLCVIDKVEDSDVVKIYVDADKSEDLKDKIIQSIKTEVKLSPTSIKFVNEIPQIGRKGKRFIDLRKPHPMAKIVREFEKKINK